MAINFDAIRKRLDNLSGNNKKSSSSWKPKEGEEYTVRLLSFQNNDGQPFKELWFYYGIGNNPGLLAPSQFNMKDPIQELITSLREEATKESYELAKKLYPKMRCYAPVIVRGEEDKGVQIWSFGKTVYQSLLALMLDEDYGDITDPTSGRDVKVRCSKPPGKMFAETEVLPRGKNSPLSTDPKLAKTWIESIPDVNKMFELKTPDELSKIVNDWIEGGTSSDSAGTTRGNAIVDEQITTKQKDEEDDEPAPQKPTKAKSYKSIDDAFNELVKE